MSSGIEISLADVGALVSDPLTYQRDEWEPLFARLRHEDPVHWVKESRFGSHWAVTRFNDIKEIETKFDLFSSDWRVGGVTPYDLPPESVMKSLIMMDPPEQAEHREIVKSLGLSQGIAPFEDLIRTKTRAVIEELPRGEKFDWVDRVSIEITSTMLAAMMGYPFAGRRELVHWSDVVTCFIDDPDAPVSSEEQRTAEILKFAGRMTELWEESAEQPAETNLLSILAHSKLMEGMPPRTRLDTLVTFLIGGNDTTRNTISGGLWALWEHPNEFAKLRNNPSLLSSFVQETVRWQTASMCMRRNVTSDCEFKGQRMHKGDKIILWWISGNRDDDAIERAGEFIVDRKKPGRHLAFGHGVHRCLGAKLAEMELRIFWEEMLGSGLRFEVLGKPEYGYSATLRSIRHLPVVIAN